MLGVAPCPDGRCPHCSSVAGHYYHCPDNPAVSAAAFETRTKLKVSKEDLEAASRIESAQKRIAGFTETVH